MKIQSSDEPEEIGIETKICRDILKNENNNLNTDAIQTDCEMNRLITAPQINDNATTVIATETPIKCVDDHKQLLINVISGVTTQSSSLSTPTTIITNTTTTITTSKVTVALYHRLTTFFYYFMSHP